MDELHKELCRIISKQTEKGKLETLLKIVLIYFKKNKIEVPIDQIKLELNKKINTRFSKKSLHSKINQPLIKKVLNDLVEIAKKI